MTEGRWSKQARVLLNNLGVCTESAEQYKAMLKMLADVLMAEYIRGFEDGFEEGCAETD